MSENKPIWPALLRTLAFVAIIITSPYFKSKIEANYGPIDTALYTRIDLGLLLALLIAFIVYIRIARTVPAKKGGKVGSSIIFFIALSGLLSPALLALNAALSPVGTSSPMECQVSAKERRSGLLPFYHINLLSLVACSGASSFSASVTDEAYALAGIGKTAKIKVHRGPMLRYIGDLSFQ